MKKYLWSMLSIMLMATLSVNTISCSKDDEEKQTVITENDNEEEIIVDANIPIEDYYFADLGLHFDGYIYYNIISDTQKTVEVYKMEESITNIIIPDYVRINGIKYAVTKIAYGASKECSVESITIGSNIKEIESSFSYNPIHSIIVSPKNSTYDSRNNCNAIIETASNTLIAGSTTTVVPDGIVEIGKQSFLGIQIKSLNLPNSVRVIGENAFSSSGLNTIIIPESVKVISEGAFNNSMLTSIILPSSINKIEKNVFSHCDELTSVSMPESIEEIGEYAFFATKKLSYIAIPDKIKKIGSNAFNHSGLVSITLNGVKEIDEEAFCACNQLRNVYIGDICEDIGNYAFLECENLNSITLKSSYTRIRSTTFYNTNNCPIYVPSDNLDYYIKDEEWKYYVERLYGM